MYNPTTGCSAVLHILIKYPIIAVSVGLIAAVSYLSPMLENKTAEEIETSPAFQEMVANLSQNESNVDMADKSLPVFKGIAAAETGAETTADDPEVWFEKIKFPKTKSTGVHSDGVSYGPAGLTKMALTDVLRKIPSCVELGYEEILNDPEASTKFAYLYFLDLINRFGNIETAVIAYNFGPTRTARYIRQSKPLPTDYLEAVRKR